MKLPELSKPDAGRLGRAEADHHVGLIFPQIQNIERAFQMQLDFRILRGKLLERGRGKQRVQPVRDADAHGAFRLIGFRLQVAGDRIERVIQPAQGLGERLSAAGQCDPARCRNEKLRADHVL